MEDKEAAGEERPEFSAFISYSHADAADVRKLHAKLEAYRLPKGLGQIDALNSRKSGLGLGKVFRDREDLSAAENLSDAVTDALSRSEVLIVACSPEAKASHWVGQEIAYFREHCPGRPILAAIMRGEPAEAFPDALTEGGVEPLAADLRKEGDGWKLGFLKVVAGIAGVPLDALVQRESQRQMRRVMAVTGMVALLAIVMGVMTTMAIQARNEAQQERDAAEGLVAYMMTDLRRELIGVGRLDVMEAVNRRALKYYSDNADLSDLSAQSLERRAGILHALGEDELKSKSADLALARSYFDEAHRFTKSTLDRNPGEPDSIFAHGQSRYFHGLYAYTQDDWKNAGKWWGRYKASANDLLKVEGKTERAQRELVYAEGNLCTLAVNAPEEVERSLIDHCGTALDLMRASIGDRLLTEKNAEDLINRLNWYAFAVEKTEGSENASEHYLRAEQIVDELIERDPRNLDLKDIWLTIQIAAARLDIAKGNIARALSRLRSALSVSKQLTGFDGANRDWGKRTKQIEKLIERISR